ncbi:putative gram-negative bacteria binding protein [Microdochium trichocladiopsis]|uniref:Gram-negative bacteria binding protein n=1 Tax=Microdochium trichocladiopsis TaxID=1682393 RepID=A0A9P8Y9W7_9PEZI|nr:putative gram-negative bacteria binding protein [Microdochium trichocladiopsis]KAH7031439.1 putative gram-negative bacteria binding protein [Microdochium trichocladiopsis]
MNKLSLAASAFTQEWDHEELREPGTPAPPKRRFQSSRLVGEYEQPWLAKRDPREKFDKIFFYGFLVIGLAVSAYLCYDGWKSVGDEKFCLLWDEDFSNGINPADWNHVVRIDGFGTGSFDWSTNDSRNSYTDHDGLHIVPTMTVDDLGITPGQIIDGYSLNLTADGTCTDWNVTNCAVTSNKTTGAIINPVRSARLDTKGKRTMKYGKVEVVAKLPAGDWLWPAIWMMPQDDVYGSWPASGEIDIMESRGNNPAYYKDGRNTVGGTLHWGPNTDLDMFAKTTDSHWIRHTDYSKDFHLYGLVWTDTHIYTYVDNVLRQTLYVGFSEKAGTLYQRGGFDKMNIGGGGSPFNPWAGSKNFNAPFDQSFYLILNVGVGSTNGYFADGRGGKPWTDKANNSMAQFWNAKGVWQPTWGGPTERGMTVKSVKMYNLC